MIPKKIAIIVNPAAGQDTPTLKTFNDVFTANNIDWDILITKKAGHARLLASEAVRKGYDIVVAHGGDGTVKEVAHGLLNSNVPLGIIPGGTANVLAVELGIPLDLAAACEVISKPNQIRSIDTGTVNDDVFVLRLGMGFEADMVRGASRSLKNFFGGFAYGLSALRALVKSKNATYKMRIDGAEFSESGISCIITNAGNIGISGLSLSNKIKVDDGLFDVIVIQNPNFFNMIPAAITDSENWNKLISPLLHFSGKDISIEMDPNQKVQCDGERYHASKFVMKVLPGSLKVVV